MARGISSQQTVHRGLLEDVLLRDLRVRQAPDLGDCRSLLIGDRLRGDACLRVFLAELWVLNSEFGR